MNLKVDFYLSPPFVQYKLAYAYCLIKLVLSKTYSDVYLHYIKEVVITPECFPALVMSPQR